MLNKLITALIIAALSANAVAVPCNEDNNADLDEGYVYQVSENKAYKIVDGLVSNEWVPLTRDGYIDDYEQTDKAQTIKAANDSLKKIRGNL